MSFRDDAVGMFWQNVAAPKTRGERTHVPRALPPTPETDWRPPKEFPRLDAAHTIAVDVETKDVELHEKGPGVRRGAHIVGLAVGTNDGGRWYFPMRHEVEPEYNLDPDAVMAWAKDALAGSQTKVGTNILYDADFLAEAGVALGGEWEDVQVAEPLLDENRFTYNLNALAMDHLGEKKVYAELEKWSKQAYGSKRYAENIWRTSPRLVGPYAEGDVDLPLRILEKQRVTLAQQGLTELYGIECGILPLLLAMRRAGVRVDVAKRDALDRDLTEAIDLAQARLDAVAGFNVNVNAGAQLKRVFDKECVPYGKTAKGAASFTSKLMSKQQHPLPLLVVEVRKLMKYRDTFVRGYFEHAINGRIHCLFHPMKGDENGTVSGRFASSDPNLQNIPIRDEVWGPKIRAMFVPEDGEEWTRHDWSQIEYRFLAHFGIGDSAEVARRMYRTNPKTDFHVMVSELTGLDRKPAKNVNFGLVYGMGPPLLAATLGMTLEEAKAKVFNVYHEKVPFVRETYDRASSRASVRGYVKTILGRRARFDLWAPGRFSNDDEERTPALPRERALAEYGQGVKRAYTHKALNRVLQGSAADLMKKAMYELWKSGVYNTIKVPLLTVHDELDHSVAHDRAQQKAIREVKRIMETTMSLRVPIIAEEERGPSWGECR